MLPRFLEGLDTEMDCVIEPSDMIFDTTSFDLPRCTLSPPNDCITDLELLLPNPQPFKGRKVSSPEDAAIYLFIQGCKAATGKDIVANEPGKWILTVDEREESANRTALIICQQRNNTQM